MGREGAVGGGGGRGGGPYRESVGNGESRRETNSRRNMHTSKRFLEQYYDLVGITPFEFLQCGTADAKNNVPSVENPELKNVLCLQPAVDQKYCHACLAHCHEFLPCRYLHFPLSSTV